MRRAVLAVAAVLLLAAPAHAENPVLDTADDEEIVAALAEATEVQGVCYGYELDVFDGDTGQFSGTFATSSLGAGQRATTTSPRCRAGTVELLASITYTSSFSESPDRAAWTVSSSVPGLDIGAVEDLGLSAGDLLDDGRSATTLVNAVLSLPRLAAEQAGLPPIVLEPFASPLPQGAAATGTPGSDWLRDNGTALFLCVLLLLGGAGALLLSRSQARAEQHRARQSAPRGALHAPPTNPFRSDR